MLPELGHFALILALAASILQASLPWWPKLSAHACAMALRAATWVQCSLLMFAAMTLLLALYHHDMSVVYVAKHVHERLPVVYRLAALWGGHEGSFLLWMVLLSVWGVAVSLCSHALPVAYLNKVLSVMGMVGGGFLLFVLWTSNPFLRYLPWVPAQGQDLNPLLQDPALAIHPPMLYAGYVGFAVAFAFAVAALWEQKLEAAWAAWVRPWALLAWACLTYGIVLGSWWAYRELGWGGWWFWDPVENASLMPWLAGTALLHATMGTAREQRMRVWTLVLAMLSFALSLLGTFLVRSGVLVSVHAFAVDPSRGLFMLVYMAVVIGAALALLLWRLPALAPSQMGQRFDRSHWLWMNVLCLTVMLITVVLGTLYPLAYQALGFGRLSVGAPYFNQIMVALAWPLLFAMGIGPLAKWGRPPSQKLWRVLACCLVCLVLLVVIMMALLTWPLAMCLACMMAAWISFGLIGAWWRGPTFPYFKAFSWSRAAMGISHLGVVVFVLGVAVSGTFGTQRDVVWRVGDQLTMGALRLQWQQMEKVTGPNYTAKQANVNLFQGDDLVAVLHPQQRLYQASGIALAETAIHATLWRDVYVALGQPMSNDAGAWTFRVYHKPLVRWVWAGGAMMAVGGCMAAVVAWRRRGG